MNKALEKILSFLYKKRYIGNRHFPEQRLKRLMTFTLSRDERREFEKEYKNMLNSLFLIKLKKRTGKGSEWHISLNPGQVNEIKEMLRGEHNEE